MISQANEQSEIRQQLKTFLLVIRWLAVLMGLIMSRFGNQEYLIYDLPPFLTNMPILISFIFILYQSTASFVQMKFDNNKIFMFMLVVTDVLAGLFMSYYYGFPYFYSAVLVPTLIATLNFDLLYPMLIGISSFICYLLLNALPVIGIIQNDQLKNIKLAHFFDLGVVLMLSSIAIFLGFKWSLDQEEKLNNALKKFVDEKNILFENHQATKAEFTEVLKELNSKQEMIEELESALEKETQEKNELIETLEETHHGLEKMNEEIDERDKTVQMTQQGTKRVREEMETLTQQYTQDIKEKEEIIRSRDEIIEARDRLIDERDETIRELERTLASTHGQRIGEIEDLKEKISLLVGKINQLNSALIARENLFESYSRINESIELQATYDAIIKESSNLVPSQTAILFMFKPTEEGPMLNVVSLMTPYSTLFTDFAVVPGDGPVGMVAKYKKPLRIDNSETTLKNGTIIETLITYEKSALVMPLVLENKTMGVIYLGKPEENGYSDKQMYLMQSFCKLAVPTINTAQSYNKATQVVLTDEKTGLFNEAYFYERLREETARSVRHKIPISLAFIEIENYENFAEKAEKAVQDRLIRDLSEILRNHTRETDLAARISDNRFAIIFMHSEKKDTILVAERIRMSAEMRSFGAVQAKNAGLQMSIGLASMPDDTDDREELFKISNRCLEDAKSAGGNRTLFINKET